MANTTVTENRCGVGCETCEKEDTVSGTTANPNNPKCLICARDKYYDTFESEVDFIRNMDTGRCMINYPTDDCHSVCKNSNYSAGGLNGCVYSEEWMVDGTATNVCRACHGLMTVKNGKCVDHG